MGGLLHAEVFEGGDALGAGDAAGHLADLRLGEAGTGGVIGDGEAGEQRERDPVIVARDPAAEPGAGQPAMTSTYVYKHPVSGRSSPTDPTPGSFLGFAEIDVHGSGQSGSAARLTINTYDYAPVGNDWGGHLATRATFDNTGTAWAPLEHDLYVPAANSMLGGLSTMTFTSRHEHRVCADGATAASCAAQYDATTTRQEWTPYPATGTTKLWLKSVERTVTPLDLERYDRTAYEVRYTATTTRLRPRWSEAMPNGSCRAAWVRP